MLFVFTHMLDRKAFSASTTTKLKMALVTSSRSLKILLTKEEKKKMPYMCFSVCATEGISNAENILDLRLPPIFSERALV